MRNLKLITSREDELKRKQKQKTLFVQNDFDIIDLKREE